MIEKAHMACDLSFIIKSIYLGHVHSKTANVVSVVYNTTFAVFAECSCTPDMRIGAYKLVLYQNLHISTSTLAKVMGIFSTVHHVSETLERISTKLRIILSSYVRSMATHINPRIVL